jgi:hypothetical protein
MSRRRNQPPLVFAVPLSRFTSRVGGNSAFYVRLSKLPDFVPQGLQVRVAQNHWFDFLLAANFQRALEPEARVVEPVCRQTRVEAAPDYFAKRRAEWTDPFGDVAVSTML